jgi:hypothetical protein
MKQILNGVLFDTFLSKRIIEVDTSLGKRTLYATMRGNYFTIENGTEIVPCTKAEALEFVRIYQSRISPIKFSQILNVFFGVNDKVRDPLKNAQKIAECENEILFLTFPGRQFYLVTGEKSEIISETKAIEFIEKIQKSLDDDVFDRIVRNHFATIRTA